MTIETWTEHPTFLRGRPIERVAGLAPAEFERRFVEGHGRPAIVTDEMADWPARTRWTFDLFRERYGDDQIYANSPLLLEEDVGCRPVQVLVSLRDYIDGLLDPAAPRRVEFLRGTPEELAQNGLPLYAPSYRALALHPELAADLHPVPRFCDDWLSRFPASLVRFLELYGQPINFLLVAPTGGKAFLHQDYWGTHTYLAQLVGRKVAVLFSPADTGSLHDGAVRDPFDCDPARFPRFAQATPHVAVLEPGELLFVPSLWWHFVITLEPSLTFSRHLATASNVGLYLASYHAYMLGLATRPSALAPELRQRLSGFHLVAVAEQEDLLAQAGSGRKP